MLRCSDKLLVHSENVQSSRDSVFAGEANRYHDARSEWIALRFRSDFPLYSATKLIENCPFGSTLAASVTA